MYVDVGLYLVWMALAVPEDHQFGDVFLAYSVHAQTFSLSRNTSGYRIQALFSTKDTPCLDHTGETYPP